MSFDFDLIIIPEFLDWQVHWVPYEQAAQGLYCHLAHGASENYSLHLLG